LDNEWNKYMVIGRKADSTNGMVLNGWVDTLNYLERRLCLRRRFDETSNLRLSDDLDIVSVQ